MHMYAMLCSLIGELGSTSNEAIYYLDGWDNTTVCLLPFSFHCTLLLPLCNSSFTSLRVHTFHKHCCPSIEPRPVLSSSHHPRSCPFSPFCSLLSISTPFTSSSFPSFPILPLSTNHFDSCEHSCGSLCWSFPWHSSNRKIVSKTSYSWQLHIYIFKVPITGEIIRCNKSCGIKLIWRVKEIVICMTGAHRLILCKINMTLLQAKDKVQSSVQRVQSDGILCYAWRMVREDGVHPHPVQA